MENDSNSANSVGQEAPAGWDLLTGEANGPHCCGGKLDCDVREYCAGQAVQQPSLTPRQKEVLDFLDGAGPLDCAWFGENSSMHRGEFWWRAELRAAFAPQQPGDKPAVGEGER